MNATDGQRDIMTPAMLLPERPGIEQVQAVAGRWGAEQGSLGVVSVGAAVTYPFRSGDELRFLRLTGPSWRTRAEVEAELAFVCRVREFGVDAGAPLASNERRWIEEVDFCGARWLATVFASVAGTALEAGAYSEQYARECGRTLGRMHRAAEGWTLPEGRRPSWADDQALVASWLPPQRRDLRAAQAAQLERLRALTRGDGAFGLVHADFGGTNALWDGTRVGVIDFDDCRWDWFASDLATALWHLRAQRGQAETLSDALLAGYAQERSLSAEIRELLPFFGQVEALGELAWRSFGGVPVTAGPGARSDEELLAIIGGAAW